MLKIGFIILKRFVMAVFLVFIFHIFFPSIIAFSLINIFIMTLCGFFGVFICFVISLLI